LFASEASALLNMPPPQLMYIVLKILWSELLDVLRAPCLS
jgi:hypothetical protein